MRGGCGLKTGNSRSNVAVRRRGQAHGRCPQAVPGRWPAPMYVRPLVDVFGSGPGGCSPSPTIPAAASPAF
jgi:hypothetical protein